MSLPLIKHFLKHFNIYLFTLCKCTCGVCGVCMIMCMWRSEDNLKELVPSSHHVGPGDGIQVFRLGKFFCPLSHLAGPPCLFPQDPGGKAVCKTLESFDGLSQGDTTVRCPNQVVSCL